MSEEAPAKPRIEIYTDGACEPNPGPGGWAAVLLHPKKRKEECGGFRKTTNNRMELFAAIRGLETLKEPCRVTLYSDSKYVVDGMRLGWAKSWQKRNWWRTSQERAENFDLWGRLLAVAEKHEVEFVWVRGHAGNKENECCDQLSCAALLAPDLPVDEGYENKPDNAGGRPKPKEGEPCWHCATPVIKRLRKAKPNQDVFNAFFFYCPKCRATYETAEARQAIEKTPSLL
jgi:ribonuclease HI